VQVTSLRSPAKRRAGTFRGWFEWRKFLELSGKPGLSQEVAHRTKLARSHDCAAIVFTQGTETSPKGVMLTHDNLTWTATAMQQHLRLARGDRVASLAPLSTALGLVVSPPPRTKWTRRVPHPVLIGHAASLTPY
jgi:long-subunit acyl-CoA synthetase (AMP-forming)